MSCYFKTYKSLILIFLMIGSACFGQSYNFINYDIDDGLAHEKIVDITQDQFGNLWIATLGGGLSRFNGLEFENFTVHEGLGSNFIRDVLCSKNGDIWAGTANGISHFDGQKFENFQIDSTDVAGNSINVIFEDKQGLIWFSTPQGGLGSIDPSKPDRAMTITNLVRNDRIIAINEDNNGVLHFISSVKGLQKYSKGKTQEVISNADFKGFQLSLNKDEHGGFLIGTNKGLITVESDNEPGNYSTIPYFKDVFVRTAEVDTSGNGWAISGFGLLRAENGNVKVLNAQSGFSDIGVNCLFKDREGNIWIGTDGEGVYKLTNEVYVSLNERNGLSGFPISTVTRDSSGAYWFGTFGGGVDRFENGDFTNFNIRNGLQNMYISTSCTDSSGNVWFGTRGSGLIKYDGSSFQSITEEDGLINDFVRCLYADNEGNIWVGTVNGLSLYDGAEFSNFTMGSGLPDNLIWNITPMNDGRVMVVTRKGLNYFHPNGEVHSFTDDKVFENRLNTAIQDLAGNIWIGYSGYGITKITPEGEYQYISVAEGLTSNLIYHLILDNDQNLIVGTERGVDKIYLDENRNVIRIKNYRSVEGFEGIRTSPGSVFKEENGDIWFGAPKNVFAFKSAKEHLNETEPLTYIAGLKLFYTDVDWNNYTNEISKWSNVPLNLELPYDQNSLVIEYFGNSLVNPKEVKYKFRLLGLRADWSPVTQGTEAVYTNLPPGEYTFEVMAANSDEVWNSTPTQFKFEIEAPFWQSIWFYAVVVGLLVMGFKLYNDYRIRANLNKILTVERIRSEELVKVRKRMARDFHDNMGNQLASITVFANLIGLKLKDKSPEIDDLLKNIEKHTKSLFNGTKDFIWSIDPESDNLNEVFTYIKDFGEDLFENTTISFFAANHNAIDDIPLPSGWSRQIVLIFKEAMTNTLKHSNGDEVYFELNLMANHFVISLRDNGQGVASANFKTGNGFKNMKSRAEQIGSKLEITNHTQGSGLLILFKGHLQSELNQKEIRVN